MEESRQNASSGTAPTSLVHRRRRRYPGGVSWDIDNRRAPSVQETAFNQRYDLRSYSGESPAEGSGRYHQDPPEWHDQIAGFHGYGGPTAAFAADRHHGYHEINSRYGGSGVSPGAWGSWDSRGYLQNSWDAQQWPQSYTSRQHPDNNHQLQYPPQYQQQTRGYSTSGPYPNDRHWPQHSPQQSVTLLGSFVAR